MTGTTRELPMFPLGAVLFPGMPLSLRIFEPRYVAMLSSVLEETEHEFGVVLIERGSEVGGGDVRFEVGTIARILSVEQNAGFIEVVAQGTARFEVVRWLQDDPFPRAQVRELPALQLDESTSSALGEAETVVRATIARASEFIDVLWPANIELSPEMKERMWQVAGIAPLNAMDQYALLRSESAGKMLSELVEAARGAGMVFTAGWASGLDDGDGLTE